MEETTIKILPLTQDRIIEIFNLYPGYKLKISGAGSPVAVEVNFSNELTLMTAAAYRAYYNHNFSYHLADRDMIKKSS